MVFDMPSIEELVGKPFEYGGRGPDSYDCYGLVKALLEERQGVKVPDYKSPTDAHKISAIFALELHLWEPAPAVEGSVATFRIGHSTHCGYLLSETHMIHSIQKIGVCIERLDEPWKRRMLGTYRYVG